MRKEKLSTYLILAVEILAIVYLHAIKNPQSGKNANDTEVANQQLLKEQGTESAFLIHLTNQGIR